MNRKLLNSELGRLSTEEYKTSDKSRFAVVLDNVRSRHNVGSAFRTADAFRAEGMYLCGITSIPPGPEIHKSALGAEYSVDWKHVADTADANAELKSKGFTIVSIEQTENSIPLEKFIPEKDRSYAFVFGNEVKGVQQKVVDQSDLSIEIPQFGTKHSLNVSVSIGVVLWDYASKNLL